MTAHIAVPIRVKRDKSAFYGREIYNERNELIGYAKTYGVGDDIARAVNRDHLFGELVDTLTQTLHNLDAMAEEGLVAKDSYSRIEKLLARVAEQEKADAAD